MTQQGAALQNYNNELVKCREGRRAGFPARIGVTPGPASLRSPPCRGLGVLARALASPQAPRRALWGGSRLWLPRAEGGPPSAAALLPGAHSAARPGPTGIEELCQKREELCRQIQQEEDEKQRLQNEVRQLTEKLARVNENLARKIASRNEFDRTIAETEAAYLKHQGDSHAGRTQAAAGPWGCL
ncbi:hypothetical protein P7K49_002175 [Saguinus oedipus]|uniref:Sjoegren syndrome nuclear autoantigen 1 n=1 Tax=Saguinus oedipus TaxID=9490 RepID=A0ABQ9WIK4_SAGOE|nr:hypothetical protein P7K49_002175 [Saguinus oedipus]